MILIKLVHPSAPNKELAKSFLGTIGSEVAEAKPPPKYVKHLSDQVRLLWRSLGVTRATFDRYIRRHRRGTSRHAFLVGVGDPFGCLPEGHVLATGCFSTRTTLFTTRFPCVLPEHGR